MKIERTSGGQCPVDRGMPGQVTACAVQPGGRDLHREAGVDVEAEMRPLTPSRPVVIGWIAAN